MAIKIDQTGPNGLYPNRESGPVNGRKNADNGVNGKNGGVRDAGGDTVSLTGEARRAAATERAAGNTPVIDEARVESIRSAILNGEYSVDAERVADKILKLERDL